MELACDAWYQIEALLRCLLETEGVEIIVRKSTEVATNDRDRALLSRRRQSTKNVVWPTAADAPKEQDKGAGVDNKTSDALRPMLSIKQVLAKVPFSRSTLYREVEQGRFPRAHEVAPRRIAWFEEEVEAWQKALDKCRKLSG